MLHSDQYCGMIKQKSNKCHSNDYIYNHIIHILFIRQRLLLSLYVNNKQIIILTFIRILLFAPLNPKFCPMDCFVSSPYSIEQSTILKPIYYYSYTQTKVCAFHFRKSSIYPVRFVMPRYVKCEREMKCTSCRNK